MSGLASFKKLEQETKRLDQKTKVTVFWDIENVRPVKNTSVLGIVGKLRSQYVEGGVEAGFVVVCDVRKEPKDLVDQLREAQCQVQHVSGDKKNTSDEVLRQEMRRTVDMSSKPGRIVLISGDSDFSADLHSFRYRKGFEIILIHNDQAKEALIQCANTAIPFEQLLGGARAKATQKQKTKGDEKPKKEIQQKSVCKSRTGSHDFQMIKYKKTNEDWYCSEHQNRSQKGPWTGQNFYKCQFCPRHLCQMCHSSFSLKPVEKTKEGKGKDGTKPKGEERKNISEIACKENASGHHFQMIKYKENNDDWWCSGHQRKQNKGNWPGKIHYKCQFCPIKLCEDCFQVKHGKSKNKANSKAKKEKCDEVGCNMQLRKLNPEEKWKCGYKNCPLGRNTQGFQYYKCQWCDALECEFCISNDSDSD